MKLLFCDIETRGLEAAYDPECQVVLGGFMGSGIKKVVGAAKLGGFLSSVVDKYRLVFHNSAFDLSVIKTHYGDELYERIQYHDTMLMAYCLNTAIPSYSLDNLAELFLGKKKVKVADFRTASQEQLIKRVIGDIKLTQDLFYQLKEELQEDEEAWEHYKGIELPYVRRIIEMQLNGLQVDTAKLAHTDKLLNRYHSKLSLSIRKKFYAFKGGRWKGRNDYTYLMPNGEWFESSYSNLGGKQTWEHCKLEPWNPNSPQQTCKVLKKLYPRVEWNFRKTKDGKDTVKSEELIEMAEVKNLPLLNLLANQNKTSHYISSFVTPINKLMRDTGRIYANMNQIVTRTGRLSSSNPNLQNIPRKGKVGSLFRSVFTARPGYSVVVGDLDRIELVVLAHYLEEYGFSTYMADAIRSGADLHSVNTESWICKQSDVSAETWARSRDAAKKGIFTLVYGASDEKFAHTMGMSIAQAQEVKLKIQESTGLFDFRDMVTRQAIANGGLLHDWLGRRLYVPELLSAETKAEGERKINNYIIQSTAGSVFKVLQNDASFALNILDIDNYLCVVVHDEAFYEVSTEQVDEAISVLNSSFCNDQLLNIAVTANFKAALNWKDAK